MAVNQALYPIEISIGPGELPALHPGIAQRIFGSSRIHW
jgi:hypothetical protein